MNSLKSDNASASTAKPTGRLLSLDQFRGYTVVGMMLVNFLGGYSICPQVLEHSHDYCSYADTIMPHFLFAVGFALRLTFGRRVQTDGSLAAYVRMVRRLLGLVLVSMVIYTVGPRAANWMALADLGFWGALAEPLKRDWFQTLMHIAMTSLWILPVVQRSARIRIGWMVVSALAHVALSHAFNFQWTNTAPNAIDGGPLGFLTWCVPAILGTLACDWFVRTPAVSEQPKVARVLTVALGVMVFGYLLSCASRLYDVPVVQVPVVQVPADQVAADQVAAAGQASPAAAQVRKLATSPVVPDWSSVRRRWDQGRLGAWLVEPPFVEPPPPERRQWNYWMMSQRAGTLSYLVFSGGLSLLVFIAFYVGCDRCGLHLPLFRTFGTNALAAYIIHRMVSDAVEPFFPKDSPAWFALLGLAIFFTITWLFVRQLEKQGCYLRV